MKQTGISEWLLLIRTSNPEIPENLLLGRTGKQAHAFGMTHFPHCALVIAGACFFLADLASAANARPFPQHISYTAGSIRPSNASQSAMDNAVKAKWNAWKNNYLKPAGSGKYYVKYNSNGQTVSEAHGYGMLLTALMAGSDPDAKQFFDGLYYYYRAHPSIYSQYLMAYKQNSSFEDIDGADSATDGDMDIGYALLLADKQWGSSGAINYLQAARNCINAILQKDVNQDRSTLRLGDWATSGKSQGYSYATATRPSDFMLSHFKNYLSATGDERWDAVATKTYQVINAIYENFSSNTGLLPDFVVYSGTYRPAPGNFLESGHDGHYSYNACRTPWRIGTDYLVSGDTRAFSQLRKLNRWIRSKTGGSPGKIKAGYKLDGASFVSYSDNAFTFPFGVSAMIEAENQSWLNAIWSRAVNGGTEDYYGDSIRLLCMFVMSRNWWSPY